MHKYGLIGYPLSHSFSPAYFTEKFLRAGLSNYFYEAYPISSIEQLTDLLQDNTDLKGLNVTIPYKKSVIPFLHTKTEAVTKMAACNCIKIIDGKLIGYNTDVEGFEASFLQKKQPHHDRALILGTGGASVAVQYVLRKLHIPYALVSRKPGYDFPYAELNSEILHSHPIIINTTPVGTFPDTDCSPDLPYGYLTPENYCYDLVYNPAKTLFLQKAEAQGATIKNGQDMLEMQAELSWKIWNA